MTGPLAVILGEPPEGKGVETAIQKMLCYLKQSRLLRGLNCKIRD